MYKYFILFSNTMKERISATIDEKTKKLLNSLLKDGKFRNISHIIEESIKLLARKENEKK